MVVATNLLSLASLLLNDTINNRLFIDDSLHHRIIRGFGWLCGLAVAARLYVNYDLSKYLQTQNSNRGEIVADGLLIYACVATFEEERKRCRDMVFTNNKFCGMSHFMNRCIVGYKFRFEPSAEQSRLLAQEFGCARFVYNHCLNKKKLSYEQA
jgi:hypothetical protein